MNSNLDFSQWESLDGLQRRTEIRKLEKKVARFCTYAPKPGETKSIW